MSVACIKVFRVLSAILSALDRDVEHMDLKGKFLYADLPASDEIMIKLPKIEVVIAATDKDFSLLKSLHKLKQTP